MAYNTDVIFKIGLLGPSRVGKTSLVTALLADVQGQLAGTGVAMKPASRQTDDKLVRNRQELEGDILAGEFRPGSLRGTMEPFTFRLKLDPGVPQSEINIELLDFPGGWLEVGRPEQANDDWEVVRSFITQSTILLIPVDAALLMEAVEPAHKRALSRLLTTVAVEQVARDWAIERNRQPAEPALLVFCPVKCESYFSDNGGRVNKSDELMRRFREAYARVIEAVRAEAPKADVLYVPVDTIGCVEVIDAEWPVEQRSGEPMFSAAYRIREPRRISRTGVDDVMRAICRQLVQGRRMLNAEQGEILSERAAQARQYADRNEGFFRNIWIQLNGERRMRDAAAQSLDREAQETWRRVAALDTQIEQIAASRFGPRVQEL
jgi:GTPase SAR1 family protein